MKTIRFIDKDRVQFAATLRKKVNDYFREKKLSPKGNGSMIFKAAIMLGMYLIPFAAILIFAMSPWLMMVLSVVIGIGMAGIGMAVMHDGAHGSFSTKGWLNKLFGNTMYLIGGNLFNWKMQHNIFHHTFTNINGYDEDIRSRVVIRMSQEEPLRKIHRFQHVYAFFLYGLMTLSKLVGDFFQLSEYNKTGVTKEQNANPRMEYWKLIASKALYLFVTLGLPLLLTSFAWWQVLIGFFIMHFTAAIIMSFVFQMAHVVEGVDQPVPENGIIEKEWGVHELMTTSNFSRKNRLLGWFIGGLNFQIEHHLFPNICHVHYRKIAPIVKETAEEFGLPYHEKKTFFHALVSHLRILRELGRKRKLVPVKVQR
ncbi:MAG TPA: acyl-CoA desaturase [Bacteroidia bacterium]|jgi:linoleoyl-CoA desaturase|nr:acyl-CoA desaturase [Bacteroidia bacterium]